MSPGHDGKLFVSALTPLAFWILLLAIRDGRRWAYGVFAFVVALDGARPLPHVVLPAARAWTVDAVPRVLGSDAHAARRIRGCMLVSPRSRWSSASASPRFRCCRSSSTSSIRRAPTAAPDTGWAFATSYAFPPREIFTLILPQFNGVLDHYWGQNPLKFHTEYMGLLPLVLADLRVRRRAAATACRWR